MNGAARIAVARACRPKNVPLVTGDAFTTVFSCEDHQAGASRNQLR
jgi:hypothetical protein